MYQSQCTCVVTAGAISRRYGYYGRGRGPIFMSYVYCRGTETHLVNCTSSLSTCSHTYDVGVECPGKLLPRAHMPKQG